MILPIYPYGQPVLRQVAQEITQNSDELQTLIDNMFETMYQAEGIGLAAPQVGISKRLFVVDLSALYDDEAEDADDFPKEWLEKMVFINPEVIEESEEEDDYNEGCLSLPDIRELITRPVGVKVNFLDRNFKPQTLTMEGMLSRCFQHELDHLDGILFIDHISAFKRKLMQRKLREIQKGNIDAGYLMK